jgi:hypothetical protein
MPYCFIQHAGSVTEKPQVAKVRYRPYCRICAIEAISIRKFGGTKSARMQYRVGADSFAMHLVDTLIVFQIA